MLLFYGDSTMPFQLCTGIFFSSKFFYYWSLLLRSFTQLPEVALFSQKKMTGTNNSNFDSEEYTTFGNPKYTPEQYPLFSLNFYRVLRTPEIGFSFF